MQHDPKSAQRVSNDPGCQCPPAANQAATKSPGKSNLLPAGLDTAKTPGDMMDISELEILATIGAQLLVMFAAAGIWFIISDHIIEPFVHRFFDKKRITIELWWPIVARFPHE